MFMSAIAVLQKKEVLSVGVQVQLYGLMAKNVTKALSDEFSRRILLSTVAEGKTIQDISAEQSVPLSTCYRRARELVDEGLLVVERIVITGDGNRYALYRSAFKTFEMTSDLASISLSAGLNDDVAEKFRYQNLVMSYQTPRGVS
jgi:hypothetical protein